MSTTGKDMDAPVTVFTSMGMLGAQVALSKLQSAGIPAGLKYEAVGQVFGLTVDGLGSVEVQVSPANEAEARELLEEEWTEEEVTAEAFEETDDSE
jgi:hypothetical protein